MSDSLAKCMPNALMAWESSRPLSGSLCKCVVGLTVRFQQRLLSLITESPPNVSMFAARQDITKRISRGSRSGAGSRRRRQDRHADGWTAAGSEAAGSQWWQQ